MVSRPPRRSAWIGSAAAAAAARWRSTSVERHAVRELLLRPAELREQLLIRLGLLHRVEVLAQQVLDERDLETLSVGRLTRDGGNPRQPGLAPARQRRSPAISW